MKKIPLRLQMLSSKRKKIILVAVVATVIGGFAVKSKMSSSRKSDRGETYKVVRKDIEHKLHLTGKIVPVSSMVVTAPQNGRVVEINVQEGTQVKNGTCCLLCDWKRVGSKSC